MSGTSISSKVYQRRKQHSNCAGKTSAYTRISDGYQSVISSEVNSVTTKNHTTSEVVNERKLSNVVPHGDLHLEETVGSDKREHLDTCFLNDSCSSSKSNLDLDSVRVKTDADDLGECSSSGDKPTKRLRDKISERSLSRDCASGQGTDGISDSCYRSSCKFCKHPENISRMGCGNCKDSFRLPCCNSHFKEHVEIDLFCVSCMKTKETLREKSPGRVVDVSPLPSLVNASKESTSEDKSQGNTSAEATSEDESQENAIREATSEDESQENAIREATSEDESQENAIREATSEDESQENAIREATSEDESQENASAESSSEDESEGTINIDSRSEEESEGKPGRQATSEGETLLNVRTDSTSEDELDGSSDTEDEMGPMTLMLKDKKPFTSNVRIGSQFQADVPEWTGPVIDESYPIGEPLEISVVEKLHDIDCKRHVMIDSIGNWLQCREIVDRARKEVEETICGKWRRAPLFEVQTDNFECFDCILWDPYHADCAVSQELDTEEVMKQLKCIEMLRYRLAVKRRKVDHCKKVVLPRPTKR